jgi:cellulase/cellobiase CelA1
VLAIAALAAAGAATVLTSSTPALAAAAVEDEGIDCAVTLPSSVASNSKLPDPFKKISGTRITTKDEWRCRREEIKKLAEKYVYGEKPGKPTSVTGTVTSSKITVNVTDKGKSSSFSASISLPSGNGPFPAVFVLGGFGADTSTIKAAGAAVISYDPLAVGKEGTARNNKQGAFYSIYGSSSSTGVLMAWAWGVSRMIDVIEKSDGSILKADATGVTGCSRYGKGAFVIGVFDQRIDLTMPIESGTAGVGAFRSIPQESGSQPLSSGYSEQPWLGDAFGSYTGNPAGLPVDTHEMVGMVAPRGLFIMDNPHIDWLGAKSGSVGALGGAEVYKALGASDNITYWSDITDGNHCAVRSEWKTPLQNNIKKFLLNSTATTGGMKISSKKAGSLSSLVDWQTPTLGNSQPPTSDPADPTDPPTDPTDPPTDPTDPPTDPTDPPARGCSAAVTVQNSWNSGFTTSVKVTAGSSAITGWTVKLSVPGGSITSVWNGTLSGTSVSNLSWNGPLGAGGSTEFGFQGSGSASGVTVTECVAR